MSSQEQENEVSLQLIRRVLDPDKAAEPIHHVLFVRVGNDILMEAGFFDLAELKLAMDQARATGAPATATLFIRHRLLVSPESLRQLVKAGEEILARLDVPVETR